MVKTFDASYRLLTDHELARALDISVTHVKALAKTGRIPEITISKNVRRYQLDAVVSALSGNMRSLEPQTAGA